MSAARGDDRDAEPCLLLLFDVDGTLVHVNGAGRAALRTAMTEVYGETGPIETFDFHGRTDPEIVRGLLRAAGRADAWIDESLPLLWERYVGLLRRELRLRRETLRVCPGVGELLERVAVDPYLAAGLLTGNVEAGAWAKLGACELGGAFAFGAFGSDSEHRGDLPPVALRRARRHTGVEFRPDRVLVIGDTPEDVRCAEATGLRSLGVATGRYSVGELTEEGADAVVPTLRECGPLLDEMLRSLCKTQSGPRARVVPGADQRAGGLSSRSGRGA